MSINSFLDFLALEIDHVKELVQDELNFLGERNLLQMFLITLPICHWYAADELQKLYKL